MMMIAQPILGGPENSGRNVVRIATLCYPILLVGIFYLYNFSSILKNNFIFYSLIIFFIFGHFTQLFKKQIFLIF